MPIDLRLLGDEGKALFREWKNKVEKHNKYTVKNKYHKEQKMDMWHKELNELNDHYRKALKAMESDKKKEKTKEQKAADAAREEAKDQAPKMSLNVLILLRTDVFTKENVQNDINKAVENGAKCECRK